MEMNKEQEKIAMDALLVIAALDDGPCGYRDLGPEMAQQALKAIAEAQIRPFGLMRCGRPAMRGNHNSHTPAAHLTASGRAFKF